jgi:hypothetical protein
VKYVKIMPVQSPDMVKEELMIVRRLVAAVVVLLCLVPANQMVAAAGCGASTQYPSACRSFTHELSESKPLSFGFVSTLLPDHSQAETYFSQFVQQFSNNSDNQRVSTSYQFGDQQTAFSIVSDSIAANVVVFEQGNLVAGWFVDSMVQAKIDGIQVLHDVLLKQQKLSFQNDSSGRVMSLLPTTKILPSGFTIQDEDYEGGIKSVDAISSKPTKVKTPEITSTPDLQATIAALQTQVSESPANAPAQAPTPSEAAGLTLSVTGSGINTTQSFAVAGSWDLIWSYDCGNFGTQGNFIVNIYDGDGSPSFTNVGVNQLGALGSGVEHYHSGGSFYLVIISECNWSVSASG